MDDSNKKSQKIRKKLWRRWREKFERNEVE